ncbi:MAG TPA: hypothetical protein VFN67_32180 [Polyangiales bacterium]|nr:hypothetical protein [Polyangiales bacterium]
MQRIDALRDVNSQLVSRIGAKDREPQLVRLRCCLEPITVLADFERDVHRVCEKLAGRDGP